eukprot:SAG31_NODE_509_length_14732_cov_13.043600_2_plen_41_part_00
MLALSILTVGGASSHAFVSDNNGILRGVVTKDTLLAKIRG